MFVSGYAYPFIQQQILEDTLPWLTAVNVFSYGFTTQGELVPPTVDPAWMVREARRQNVRPVLPLTPLGADYRLLGMAANRAMLCASDARLAPTGDRFHLSRNKYGIHQS